MSTAYAARGALAVPIGAHMPQSKRLYLVVGFPGRCIMVDSYALTWYGHCREEVFYRGIGEGERRNLSGKGFCHYIPQLFFLPP